MSTNNFLQRFKGKTNQIGKGGIRPALNDYNPDAIITTNTTTQYTTVTKKNTQMIQKTQKVTQKNMKEQKQKPPTAKYVSQKKQQKKINKNPNPFLISNPFYLDEEQKLKQQKQKKIAEKQRLAKQAIKKQIDAKQSTKISITRSLQKKSNKQWTKLGGLGPNIGGQQWQEKRKKLQKMQQFAGQVKSINSEKIKPPSSNKIKQQKKEPNARQKALQYSKNVPKPIIKKYEQQQIQQQQPIKQKDPNQMTQLEIYAAKHEKLKYLLKNDY